MLHDVLEDVRRVTGATELPLLVDVDTGFGATAFSIARTVGEMATSRGTMVLETTWRTPTDRAPGRAVRFAHRPAGGHPTRATTRRPASP